MSQRGIEELLGEVGIFEGLAGEHLELMAGCGQIAAFEAGEPLFREGDEADNFFVLRHGRVALELFMPQGGAMTIATLGPGEVVGWSWLFPPYRWHMDARVVERCSALVIDGRCLREKAESNHDLGYELMKRFAAQMVERLQETRIQILDLYGSAATL